MSAAYTPLYNGNIAHTVNSLEPFAGWSSYGQHGQVLAQVYRYDQLNRLKKSQGVEGLTASTNSWNGVNDAVAERYRSTYEYDANGNILHADRWDQDGHRYDSLYYRYQMNGGHLTRNRLYQLLDLADNANSYANDVHDLDYQAVDIIDQGDAAAHVNVKNNYSYDQIGNLVKDSLEEIQHIDWTVAGKVKAIERTSGSSKPELSFGYGADGQRTIKTVGDPLAGGYREHYIRDAQGNIMATYLYKASGSASLAITERPIYGSKRLGSYTEAQEMLGTGLLPVNYTHTMQALTEHYELTDHLGNVAAVVTGRLLPVPGSGYQAELVSEQGYEAFGALLPGRNYSSADYRFGFGGQLKDDELYGAVGTAYAYSHRMYDSRIGRFLSTDFDYSLTPSISPYAFVHNAPISMVEIAGDWSVQVFMVEDRSKPALCVVRNNQGQVVAVYKAGGQGIPDGAPTDPKARRMAHNGDTPLGQWDISHWQKNRNASELRSYGPMRLWLENYVGEPVNSDRDANTVRVHGASRASAKRGGVDGESDNGDLWPTQGCIRIPLRNIGNFYLQTRLMELTDPNEGPTTLVVTNNLDNMDSQTELSELTTALDNKIMDLRNYLGNLQISMSLEMNMGKKKRMEKYETLYKSDLKFFENVRNNLQCQEESCSDTNTSSGQ